MKFEITVLERLVKDFNEYSELVALNYEHIKEGRGDKEVLEWNRGQLNRIEEYLNDIANMIPNANIKWDCNEHKFIAGDIVRILEYRTVRVVFDK